jgi:hypothetical protein
MAETARARRRPPTYIKDARGRKVVPLDPVELRLLRQHEVIPSELLRAMAKQIGVGLATVNRVALVMTLLCTVCFAVGAIDHIRRGLSGTIDTRGLSVNVVLFICTLGTLFLIWIGTRRVRFQRIARVMLKHLRCPHCGYGIRGLPTAPDDGATVCPECGCAWKVDDHRGTVSDVPQTCHPHPVKENGNV